MFGHRFGRVLRFIQRDVRHSGVCGAIAVRAMGCEPCADAQRHGWFVSSWSDVAPAQRYGSSLPALRNSSSLSRVPPISVKYCGEGGDEQAIGQAIYKPVNLQSPFTNTTQKSHLVDIFLSSLGLFPTCRTRSPTKMAVWRRTDNGVPPTPLTTSGDRPSSVISGVT